VDPGLFVPLLREGIVSPQNLSEGEIKGILDNNPGDPVFVSYSDNLRIVGNLADALRICMAGLTASPDDVKGRLVLAQIFYDLGFLPFAIRELKELNRTLPDNESIKRLLSKIAPGEQKFRAADEPNPAHGEEATVAEAEFDFDEIDLLEDDPD